MLPPVPTSQTLNSYRFEKIISVLASSSHSGVYTIPLLSMLPALDLARQGPAFQILKKPVLLTFSSSLFWCCNDPGHSRGTAQGEKGLLRGRGVLANSLKHCPMRVLSGVLPVQEAAPRTPELRSLHASMRRYICMRPSIF